MSDMHRLFKLIIRRLPWILAVLLLLYTVVPILSPVFFHFGLDRPGWWIQSIYRFFCHERPERSLFLFGPQLTYSSDELVVYHYHISVLGYPFIGNSAMGFKVPLCIRDLGLYSSMTIASFVALTSRKKISLRWWTVVLMTFPLVIDGTTQLISEFIFLTQDTWGLDLAKPFYLSNNGFRAVTGLLFGTAIGLLLFGELKEAIREELKE